jgi:diaminohydroxyphosphoribosylaminopyrimidine deaminase/5-amino-6-(5-phosphoribosylamino)uracil reductase
MTGSLHKKYMSRCLRLALNGEGTTYPNPLVGSVIVYRGKIIGEGFHYKAGEPHAEVNAINSVKNKDLLKESTLYVNLELPISDVHLPARLPSYKIKSRKLLSAV